MDDRLLTKRHTMNTKIVSSPSVCVPKIVTCKGRQLDPFHLTEEDIDLEEIAHSLSLQCRYNGATPVMYSVATHSCIAAAYELYRTSDPALALGMLLHDAAEAYIGDYVRPLKNKFTSVLQRTVKLSYNIRTGESDLGLYIQQERAKMNSHAIELLTVERKIDRLLLRKFGARRSKDWHDIDDRLAALEMRELFGIALPGVEPLDAELRVDEVFPRAKEQFLSLANGFIDLMNQPANCPM